PASTPVTTPPGSTSETSATSPLKIHGCTRARSCPRLSRKTPPVTDRSLQEGHDKNRTRAVRARALPAQSCFGGRHGGARRQARDDGRKGGEAPLRSSSAQDDDHQQRVPGLLEHLMGLEAEE